MLQYTTPGLNLTCNCLLWTDNPCQGEYAAVGPCTAAGLESLLLLARHKQLAPEGLL